MTLLAADLTHNHTKPHQPDDLIVRDGGTSYQHGGLFLLFFFSFFFSSTIYFHAFRPLDATSTGRPRLHSSIILIPIPLSTHHTHTHLHFLVCRLSSLSFLFSVLCRPSLVAALAAFLGATTIYSSSKAFCNLQSFIEKERKSTPYCPLICASAPSKRLHAALTTIPRSILSGTPPPSGQHSLLHCNCIAKHCFLLVYDVPHRPCSAYSVQTE